MKLNAQKIRSLIRESMKENINEKIGDGKGRQRRSDRNKKRSGEPKPRPKMTPLPPPLPKGIYSVKPGANMNINNKKVNQIVSTKEKKILWSDYETT